MEITTGTTAHDRVVAAAPRPHPHMHRAVALLVAVLVFVIGAHSLLLPYYRIAPGSAIDTAPLVRVPGEGRYHEAIGKVLLATVSLRKVTLLEAIEGWLDPTVDVLPEHVIAPPNVDENELRELNLQQMDESKQKAVGVAFERLGIDAIKGSGVEVAAVVADAPADGKLDVGDTIDSIDGVATLSFNDIVAVLDEKKPGDTVHLAVRPRGGTTPREVSITLVADPDRGGRAIMGVHLTTKVTYDFPFDVEVASERIGGPSAGLAFTLEILDVLTEGELTGGHRVAATGTIEVDGTVGEVGGVAQKTIAVKNAGAEVFLVPSGEYAAAKRFAGDDLRIEVADSLEDALEVLATLGGNGLDLTPLQVAVP